VAACERYFELALVTVAAAVTAVTGGYVMATADVETTRGGGSWLFGMGSALALPSAVVFRWPTFRALYRSCVGSALAAVPIVLWVLVQTTDDRWTRETVDAPSTAVARGCAAVAGALVFLSILRHAGAVRPRHLTWTRCGTLARLVGFTGAIAIGWMLGAQP
jgi:hypothetical protein